MAEYSYLVLYIPRGTSRDAARRMLTDHAEYGHWELSRLRLYPDGSRKATLRRMIIRQIRTPVALSVGQAELGWTARPDQSGPPG
jgi:hypothetical protein